MCNKINKINQNHLIIPSGRYPYIRFTDKSWPDKYESKINYQPREYFHYQLFDEYSCIRLTFHLKYLLLLRDLIRSIIQITTQVHKFVFIINNTIQLPVQPLLEMSWNNIIEGAVNYLNTIQSTATDVNTSVANQTDIIQATIQITYCADDYALKELLFTYPIL
jgi:hypothetical protein